MVVSVCVVLHFIAHKDNIVTRVVSRSFMTLTGILTLRNTFRCQRRWRSL